MSTKINTDYYGAENSFVTITADIAKKSAYTLATLFSNGNYTGGSFDATASPWGIGRSSISSDYQAQATKGATWTIYSNENTKKNTPIWFYNCPLGITGGDRPEEITGSAENSYTFARMLYKNRTSPNVTISEGDLKSTNTIDNDDTISVPNTNTITPVTFLDYSKTRVCLGNVYYKVNGNPYFRSTSFANFAAGGVTTDAIYGFDFSIRDIYGNTLNIYASIGGGELPIPDVYKTCYYGDDVTSWVRPWRRIESVGYWAIPNLAWREFNTYTGCLNTSDMETINANDNAIGRTASNGWGHTSDTPQTFDDVSYHWDMGFTRWASDWWSINKVNTGDTFESGTYRSYAYMIIDEGTADYESLTKAILHEIAFLGLPFCFSTSKATAAIGSDDIYLPVFDEHMITTGDYVNGAASLDLPNATWSDVFGTNMPDYDPEYDPDAPPDPDDDEGIKVRPSTPGFTLAGRGTQCYELIESDIDEIFDDIYGRDNKSWNKLIKGLQMFGSDPMGAIISFKWYPFTFTPGESRAVYLGNTAVNPLHQYPTADGVNKSYVSTTATFKWDKPKNFINSRHTKCRIYLPFYGFYELPISMMISKTLSVYMAYNIPDETAVWILSFDDVIYDFCECDPSIEIPLTGSNAGQIALVKRQAALSIAAQVAAIAGTAIVGATTGSGLAYLGYTASDSLVFSGALSPGIAEDVTNTLYGMAGRAGAGAGVSGLSGLGNIYNTVQNARLQIGTLQTNLPHHGAASATTFLNLPMYPYIQFIQNIKMQGYDEGQYKLKVGHACDIWTTMDNMPENSLLQTTGMADMSSMSMELNEITELNNILQTGFYR